MIDVLEILTRFAEHPAPAYLFVGGDRETKRQTVERFARMVLRLSETDSLDAHPDFIRVVREEGTKELNVKQARALVERMRLTSARGGKKVALVEQADRWNEEACNALLKAIEEPSPNEVYLFIAERSERLPATLRSRLAMIPFGHVARSTQHVASDGLLNTLATAPVGVQCQTLEKLAQTCEAEDDPVEAWQDTLTQLMHECRAQMLHDPCSMLHVGYGLIHAWHLTHSSLSPRLALEWSAVSPYIRDKSVPHFLSFPSL
ncbi:hypothetical protein FJZ48_03220 [Candidatus Uhrbacteria bacterium]|nr:hypothetical protein [Candidatus Uhrbacteria bacterium]